MEAISVPTSIASDEEFVSDVTNQQSLDSSFGAEFKLFSCKTCSCRGESNMGNVK